MARAISSDSRTVTFGVRKKGKAKKGHGPKEKSVSKYRAQGR